IGVAESAFNPRGLQAALREQSFRQVAKFTDGHPVLERSFGGGRIVLLGCFRVIEQSSVIEFVLEDFPRRVCERGFFRSELLQLTIGHPGVEFGEAMTFVVWI